MASKRFISRFDILKSASWLRNNQCGPNVYAFRNLETGQVLYSQTLHPKEHDIKQQFQFTNWQNRLPSTRKDIWRPLAVVELPSHEDAVTFYYSLVRLRYMRDRSMKEQANDWRKKSKDGNIWYYSQFRPTYSQEAVADIASAVDASDVECRIKWENEWRRGDDKYWQGLKVVHDYLPKYNPREQNVVLRQIADESYQRFIRRQEQKVAASV
jgi:hypothetical protein